MSKLVVRRMFGNYPAPLVCWVWSVRSESLCEFTQLTVSVLKRIPFSEHEATLGTQHQVHQFTLLFRTESEIWWLFAS